MATWKKVLHESSPASDFPTLNQATTGNAGTVTNGVYTTLVSSATLGWVIDEDNMSSDSATRVPTQQSVKAYVDAQEHTPEVADISDLNATAAELNTLDGFDGDVDDLKYAKDLYDTGVTATEFDYLDGVTSSIQTQLDGKQASGTYYTNNANLAYWTDDADRNFGNAGNTVTAKGSITVDQNLTVTGDLTITGDIDSYNVTVLDVADQTIRLNAGQTGTPSLDAQIVAERGDETDAKIYWDESATSWKVHNGSLLGEIVSVKTSTETNAPTADQTGVGSLYVADTDGSPVVYIRVT